MGATSWQRGILQANPSLGRDVRGCGRLEDTTNGYNKGHRPRNDFSLRQSLFE